MKKYFLLYISIISISLSGYSQHFEWAASMGKAQTETLSSVMDNEGNITQIVSWQTAYFTKFIEAHLIFDAYGDTIRLRTRRENQLVVVQFDKNGKHRWSKSLISYGRNVSDEVTLTVNANGELSVFMQTGSFHVIDDNSFEGILSENEFIKNTNSYEKGKKPASQNQEEDGEESDSYSDNIRTARENWTGLVEFKLSKEGKLIDLRKILPEGLVEPHASFATNDGGTVLLCSSSDDIILEGTKINADKAGAYILIKLNTDSEIQWAKPFYFLKNSCCSYVMPYPHIAQSPNGNIYVAGAMGGGIEFPNGKKVDFKTDPDPKKQRNQFQGFVAAFNKGGKMLWQKTTGGRNTLHSLIANDKMVYVSGKSRINPKIFGKEADTTKGKNGFIAALSAKKGKTKWMASNSSNGFVTMTQDTKGNIYGLAEYSAHRHAKLGAKAAFVFETDTFTKNWHRMIVASYDDKGKYRWMKNTTGILFQRSHYYNLLINDCNNLFLTGSAFAGMKIPSQYLDGAFMKGEAYGSMAYLSKIKNNTNQLDTNSQVKQDTTKNNPLFQYREVAGKAIDGQEGCGVSPGPWEMIVYPNPFNGQATIKIKTTFDDNNVNLLIMDMKGQTISSVFNDMKLEQGVYTYPVNAPALSMSKGTYLIVLRGSATILSERVVYK